MQNARHLPTITAADLKEGLEYASLLLQEPPLAIV